MDEPSFRVVTRSGQPISSLADWFVLAAPAGRATHWRDGRSAKELARRWVGGRVPDEVTALLATSPAFADFVPVEAIPKAKTPLDRLRGNTRNHDLLVVGRVGGEPALLDIEGKADEPFGDTIAQRLAKGRCDLLDNARSRAAERVERLCRWVLGVEPAAVGDLRYQLLQALAAAVLAAQAHGARRVAWVDHEFRVSGATSERRHHTNTTELDSFVARLAGPAAPSSGVLVGPLTFTGDGMAGVELYVGKAICVLG